MDDLSREAKNLIASVGNTDGPTADVRERVKRQLLMAAAASGAAAVASSVAKTAAAGTPAWIAADSVGSGAATSGAVANSTVASSALNGAGLASSAPAALSGAAAASVAGGSALGAAVTSGTAVTGIAAVKISASATLLGVSKAAWIAGACIAGAGLTGTIITRTSSEPGAHDATHETDAAGPDTTAPRNRVAQPAQTDSLRGAATKLAVLPDAVDTGPAEASPAAKPKLNRQAARPAAKVAVPESELPRAPVQTELSLLTAAQRALSAGDPQQALSLADQHAQNFPHSALRTERTALRVFALCRLGKVEEARRAGQIFLREGNNSPLAPRVLDSCISNTPSPSDSKTD